MKVKQRMTPSPITASPDSTHRQAVQMMRENSIRRLPVVDDKGKLVGIVSESDLLSTAPSQATTLSIYEVYTLLEKLTLKQIMSTPVIAVDEDCGLANAAHIMFENKIGCLPVVRGEELVGIITETDIFGTLVEVLGGGEPGLRVDLRVVDQKGVLATVAQTIAEADGNIVSLTTFHGEDTAHTILSIKVRGADKDGLRSGLTALEGVEIVDFRPSGTGCAVNFG
jgi:acetoin utilization protein AcuB